MRSLYTSRLGTKALACFALQNRAPLEGVMTEVGLSVKADQLKLGIPGVSDACCLVRRRPGGEREF